MLLLGKIGIGAVGTLLIGAAIVSSDGFIHIKVNEKRTNGTHLSLIVPAMIAPVAVRFVPDKDLAQASARVRQYLPVIDAAISGLRDCPDVTLVDVTDGESHVTVVKAGDSIVVDANDPQETVHVAVPLGAAQSTIDEIAAANGPI